MSFPDFPEIDDAVMRWRPLKEVGLTKLSIEIIDGAIISPSDANADVVEFMGRNKLHIRDNEGVWEFVRVPR